jgi:hypothetical protein
LLQVISRALGYNVAEACSLSGQNVRHLFRFLKNLESDASSVQDVLQGVKEYRPGNVGSMYITRLNTVSTNYAFQEESWHLDIPLCKTDNYSSSKLPDIWADL